MVTNATVSDRLEVARDLLEQVKQTQVLHFYDTLNDEQKENLLSQIEGIDWIEVQRLVQSHVLQKPEYQVPSAIEPAPWYPYQPTKKLKDKYQKARKLGKKLITQGKVAAFTVAGGQGTRLGWNGPKGSFPATPIRQTPLFGCMAGFIRKVQRKYKTVVPWYIMTSLENDAATHAFFEKHGFFGLKPKDVMIFPQAMMPAIDFTQNVGKVLLAKPSSMALAPNGHGGSLKALWANGAVADMKKRGIEQISYTQIDNPCVKVIDPLFIGLHALDQCQMSSKMLTKAYAKEKVGNFCLANNKVMVIEYSNLPDEYAEQLTDEGHLKFDAGSIAIHMIQTDFVESLNTQQGGFALPFNRAEKKVSHVDFETGEIIIPTSPNAVKLETFVFDALPLCEQSMIYQTDRIEEFAPIKNADAPDAVDTPATSKALQTERAARWLEANGVKVARDAAGKVDAIIELSCLTAIESEDLSSIDLPDEIEAGTQVLL